MPTIDLKDDTALVLFEFLSRLYSLNNDHPLKEIRFDDAAELNSLWEFHGVLEKTVVAPLDPNYKVLLEGARRAVRERWQSAK
jgi:hypothetical protein